MEIEIVDLGFLILGRKLELQDYYSVIGLLDKINEDTRFTLNFVYKDISKEILNFFRQRYPNCAFYEFNIDLDQFKFDCLLTVNPFNKLNQSLQTPFIYKGYRTEGITFDFQSCLNFTIYRNADLIIADDTNCKIKIQKRYPDKQVIIGNPDFDYIFNANPIEERPSKYNVLWVPYHNLIETLPRSLKGHPGYSVFSKYAKFFQQEFLLRYPDTDLYIEDDPRLRKNYQVLYHDSMDKYYSRFMCDTRLSLLEFGSYLPDYKKFDVLISDDPYMIKIWLPTNRPMIVLSREIAQGLYTKYGDYLIDHSYYRVSTPRELMLKLDKLLLNPLGDYKKDMRKSFIKDLYIRPGSPNGSTLVDMIYEKYKTKLSI